MTKVCQIIPLPHSEFLLGLSDLTGELMRFAITTIARGGGRATSESVSDFVRRCKSGSCQETGMVNGNGQP